MLVGARIPANLLFATFAATLASAEPISQDRGVDGHVTDGGPFGSIVVSGVSRASSGDFSVNDVAPLSFAMPPGNVLSQLAFGYEASVIGATVNDPLLDDVYGQAETSVVDRANVHLLALPTPITPLEPSGPDEPSRFDSIVGVLGTGLLALLAVSIAFAALMLLPRFWNRGGHQSGRQDGGHELGPRADNRRHRHRSGKSARRLPTTNTHAEGSWP